MGRLDHLQHLIYNHSRRLNLLKEQAALAGLAVTPDITMQIEDFDLIILCMTNELKQLTQMRGGNGSPTPPYTATTPASPIPERVAVPEAARPPRHPGLIVIVGTGRPGEDPLRQSAGKAIEYHLPGVPGEAGLQVCWLVCAVKDKVDENLSSIRMAEMLQAICQERGVRAFLRPVADSFNLQESYDLVERIYTDEAAELGLRQTEIIADFTGGTKPMSAGMILACGQHRPMQYMTGRKAGLASMPQLMPFTPAPSAR